jgi:lysophospholipase L1-like esterase
MGTTRPSEPECRRRPWRHPWRRIGAALGYGAFLLAVVLAGSEIFLRFLLPPAQGYYVWPPHLHVVFNPNDEATPGVSGPGHFIVNSLGLRSDEPWPDRQRTIYVFGGSTAADVYLDQDEAWVHLLQTYLNQTAGQPRTWVGNLARSSLATINNLLQFDYLIPQLPRADLFVNLVGVNDLQLALKSSYLRDMTMDIHLSWTFSQMPPKGLLGQSAIVRFYDRIRDWRRKANLGPTQTHDAGGYTTWRKCRQTAPPDRLVDQLPDLGAALVEYRRNLNALVDRAHQYGAPIVFLTQPALWAARMDPPDEAILLAGGLGPNNVWCDEKRYYTPRALAEGLDRFNQVTLDVCRARALFCVDLAQRIPKTRENFYDDMHFNEAGARLVARTVAQALAARYPAGAATLK